MQQLNHIAVALTGTNLIEASAGTGKTYAIASLYLRLLVEQELLPEQILVVTYTEAATQELRARIRNRIREALEVMEGGETTDAFLEELYEKASQTGMKRVLNLLERALGAFDTASIFTIHGFCLRALQDNAFESGSLYDTELVTDQTGLLRDIVEDFWRMHFFREPAPLLGYTLRNRHSPETFISLLKNLHAGTGVKVIPDFSDEEIRTLDQECSSAYSKTSALWQREREIITKLLTTDKGLKRSQETYRADLLEPLFASMDAFVAAGNPYDLFADFNKFTASAIGEGTKLKNTPPDHLLFGSCQRLLDAVLSRFLALKAELVRFYRKSLPQRKRASNVRFFDDLLEDLYRALRSDGGGKILAGLLRAKYRAALIDEFQDTDPVQYEIFRSIYAGSDLPLFLIGDPKQAIYSFRGADIFAYMRAAREVREERRFTLTDNWRSAPPLLNAFNTLFDNTRRPFLYDEILYHPLASGNRETGESGEGSESEPMQLWFMDSSDEKSGVWTVEDAGAFASKAVAGEIVRLLQDGETLVGGKTLTAGDIAVIVRTHRQAAMVLSALGARGLAGVMRSDKSIFATREAEELRILLSALGDPSNEPKVRAALVTDLLGRSGNEIATLLDDEELWTECLRSFRHYHELWLQRGCMVMSRELMAKEGVRGRLLGYADGERRLTNILHCFELLHGEEHERGVGMEGLIAWFSERLGAEEEQEEHQIRLETDEAAVKIVTIHVSKGLEYPVVFCPFLWGGANHKGEVVMFHNEQWQLVKDFGSSDIERHRSLAGKESLAESLRLLYVALTRAKYRCYLFAGKSGAATSPINYLLHASGEARGKENPATALVAEMKAMSATTMGGQLQEFAESSGGTIGFRRMNRSDVAEKSLLPRLPTTSAQPNLRSFSGKVDTGWRVSSFTSFSHHESGLEQRSDELPDRDELRMSGRTPIASSNEESIFTFPKGAQAGIFMHGIFEKLNFASPSDESILELVVQGLERYNYKPEWQPYITGMVSNVLRTPLSSPDAAFTLGALKKGSWSAELEFFFPLRFINSSLLGELLARHGFLSGGIDLAELAEALHFKPVRGMLMGFMDMVFEEGGYYYLLDWKSNHLGNSVEDYGQSAMTQAMQSNLYPLQYLLYMVALNRYLSLRVKNYRYATHFGGVIYIFLRGVSREHGESRGFFRDLPSEGLIEALTDCLIEEGG
ncbi:MAG: exodeoxyribonuclease V subunit beta [Chlorobium sp.]|nr:exodeoxyribonuclease V subunit beta [Chlorobium sp.]